MAWLLLAMAQDRLDWDLLRKAEGAPETPPEIRALEGRWVHAEGFVHVDILGERLKIWVLAETWFEMERFGTPRTPYNSARVAFRPGAMPSDVQSYDSLRISGRFRIRREVEGGKLRDLFWIVGAVEGFRPELPDAPEPPETADGVVRYSTLLKGPDDPEVRSLNGRRVSLRGHVLTSTADEQVRHFTIAKNPWDGCCLGTPPTPLDSVLVRLNAPLSNRFARTATVTGTLQVAPLSIDGELAELYFLNDAVEGLPSEQAEEKSSWPMILAVGGIILFVAVLWLVRRHLMNTR